MAKIKLNEFCKLHGIHYITGNRWFHAGKIPGAIQTQSGTILVDDDAVIGKPGKEESSEAVSLLLKKTVELSKNNGSLEDLSAYVVSNFNLQIASEEKKIELQNLVKNEGGEGTFKKSEFEPNVPWNSGWSGVSSLSGGTYSLNAAYTPEAGGISAGTFTFDGSLGNYGDPNLNLYGAQSSVFVANVVPEMSVVGGDICEAEDQNELVDPMPAKPRGRGRPKKIPNEGEQK